MGDKDAFGGLPEADAAAAANPRISIVRIADAGHAPWFDEPAKIIDAIETGLPSFSP